MATLQIIALLLSIICAIGFVCLIYQADRIVVNDDDLPFNGALTLLFAGYFFTGLTAAIIQGVGFAAGFLVMNVAGFVIWAAVAANKKKPSGKEVSLPLWLGVPLSAIWGLVPESWRCRHR